MAINRKRLAYFERWFDPIAEQILGAQDDIELVRLLYDDPQPDNWVELSTAVGYQVSARTELREPWFGNADLLGRCPNILAMSSAGAGYDVHRCRCLQRGRRDRRQPIRHQQRARRRTCHRPDAGPDQARRLQPPRDDQGHGERSAGAVGQQHQGQDGRHRRHRPDRPADCQIRRRIRHARAGLRSLSDGTAGGRTRGAEGRFCNLARGVRFHHHPLPRATAKPSACSMPRRSLG